MIETFTLKQQKAIEEKIEQLQKVINGTLSVQELADLITKRRLNWLKNNKHLLQHDLPLPESAYRLLIYDHMHVENGISMKMVRENLLKVKCKNFCPYLEASQELGLDPKFVCKEIGEPSLHSFFNEINPNFHFSRDYNHIRPYFNYCIEMLEVKR